MASEHYDVIIIGTGAGGGTLLHRLAPSGKRILVLERGPYLRREPENWDTKEILHKERYLRDTEHWLDKDGTEFHPHQQYFVGGNTKFYGAILFRLRERDFGEVRHAGGMSPAWPISYDELEPYYTEAERLYHVHGTRGEDPYEPPASAGFPYPAVSHEPRIQKLHDDLERSGHHPFHLPVGVLLDEQNPENSTCVRCDRFDGFPCLLDGKADAHVLCVRPSLQHKNVTLKVGRKVERLVEDAGEISEVVAVNQASGDEERYSADVVVAACGAVNSAALLLKSEVANSSGVVGRHYMCHQNSAVIAISKEPNPTKFQKTLGVNDYYERAGDFEFPLGHIQMLAKSDGQVLKAGAPRFTPQFTLDYMAKHAVDFWLTSEDLPDPDNRVTVERNGQIRLSYRDNNIEGHKRLLKKLRGMLHHLDLHPHLIPHEVVRDGRIPLAGVAHQNGTVRFGDDPATSALDRNCKAWDLDNLYVVDTSFFPSSAAVNPALTAMANALRVGDHLLERMDVSLAVVDARTRTEAMA
ncbi:MAG TPA: GMC family oxidoreductase [Thermoleophilaceae bacterium]|nr:GMC family oxidoreductase [Thermoleophilaceae bacterium]